MVLPEYTLYLIPPAAGALIGYITNKIAITMLFRPFREKRFLGLKIPFTPGIIPRQRYELSAQIASQVSTELFTVETVSAQVSSHPFARNLEENLRRRLDELLDTPIRELREKLSNGKGMLPAETADFLREEGIRAGRELLLRTAESDLPLEHILNPKVRKLILKLTSGLLPYVRQLVIEWLNRKTTRDELHRRGILLMRDAVNSLPSIQRLVVIAGQYDRSMEERMSFLVDKVIISIEEALNDEKTEETLLITAGEYLEGFSRRPLGEILDRDQQQRLALLPELILSPLPDGRDSFGSIADAIPPEATLGEILLKEPNDRERMVGWGRGLLTELLLKAVPGALAVMDVEKLVRNRIDSLDIQQVESLLLAVIRKHLKWINLFGALLGAMIGVSQVLLQLLR